MYQPNRGRTGNASSGAATCPIAPTTSRRQAPRYAVAEDQAWLGWWEGSVYRRSQAALVDISQGGAKLYALKAPPRRSTVFICLDGHKRTDWVEATVVEVTRLDNGTSVVRIAFQEICPYAFFEVAVHGQQKADTLAPIPARIKL